MNGKKAHLVIVDEAGELTKEAMDELANREVHLFVPPTGDAFKCFDDIQCQLEDIYRSMAIPKEYLEGKK